MHGIAGHYRMAFEEKKNDNFFFTSLFSVIRLVYIEKMIYFIIVY